MRKYLKDFVLLFDIILFAIIDSFFLSISSIFFQIRTTNKKFSINISKYTKYERYFVFRKFFEFSFLFVFFYFLVFFNILLILFETNNNNYNYNFTYDYMSKKEN